MTARLPLNALYAFCAVVKHGGIRQAAQVLHVTPGAVSKQIQLLEVHLTEVLFERVAGNMATPTPAGARLYKRIANEMAVIGKALGDDYSPVKKATVLVDTNVTFAMYWLIPLLARFKEAHPDIEVQVRTTDGPINTAAPIDVYIRREEAELRGLPCQTFMVEESVLVSAPAFKARLAPRQLRGARWIKEVPRIGMRSRTDLWAQWSKSQGIAENLEPTIEYDNTVLAIQAALQGLGVLVVPEVFVSAMLQTQSLTLMATDRIRTGTYSYAIARQRDSVRTAKFTDWLMACGRNSAAAVG